MNLGERVMNIRGITAVIVMVGFNAALAILGMVIVAVIHDGDVAPTVINNLQLIAVSGIGIAGTLIAHYIGAGAAQQQLQTQASMPPTATVPVQVTATPAPTPAATGEASNGGV